MPTALALLRTPRRLARRVLLALAGLLATATVASAASPPQGLYEECAPSNGQQCASELAQMGGAGFRLVLNYTAWYGSAADIQAYASEAQAQGIKLIWPLNDPSWRDGSSLTAKYPQLAADCQCATNDAFIQYAVNLVQYLPATWGFYVGDEVGPWHAPLVAALAAKVRALDPFDQLLYVGRWYPDLLGSLDPFLPSADVVGADVYPIGEGVPVSTVGQVATTVGRVAGAAGKTTAMVLQAFSWAQHPTEIQAINPRWPSESEMQNMCVQALAANPSMILWYNFNDILHSDNPAQHWQDLVAAASGCSQSATTNPSGEPPTRSSAVNRRTTSAKGVSVRASERHEPTSGAGHHANRGHGRPNRDNRHRHLKHPAHSA